jgi:DNA topoisomerase-1
VTTTNTRAADPVEAGLLYLPDDGPGWTRRKRGRGFSYLDQRGKVIQGERALERIRALAIPPAWTDVWINPEPRGHLQATGRDARGRKQYRYHAAWRAHCEAVKYERLIDFGEALPNLRRAIAADVRRRGLPREKVVATVVHLLETSLIRVGNESYAKANGSFGLTTLRSRQVEVHGAELHFRFRGKSGQWHDVAVLDRRAARVVRQCQDLPGQQLFRYETDGGNGTIDSDDVNGYIRDACGEDFTSKDFRTWMGTLMAATALAVLEPPRSDAAARREAAAALQVVARHLGNTPTVARTAYVHPDVVDLYVDGELEALWSAGPSRDTRWLVSEERKLLSVLRAARRRQQTSAGRSGHEVRRSTRPGGAAQRKAA